MIGQDTTVIQLYELGLLSRRAKNVCLKATIMTLGQLMTLDEQQITDLKSCGRKTREELNFFKDRYLDGSINKRLSVEEQQKQLEEAERKAKEKENEPKENVALNEAQKKFTLLTLRKKYQLKDWVTWRFDQLSVRAKRAFPTFDGVNVILPKIYSGSELDFFSIRYCGEKTEKEIIKYLNEVKAFFEDITENVDIDSEEPEIDETEREEIEICRKYPFLTTPECKKIVNFKQTTNKFPFLYITKKYILRSGNLKVVFGRDYYGLNDTNTRYSLQEIADAHDLTRERVRQIVEEGIPLPHDLQDFVDLQLGGIIGDIAAFDDEIWGKLQQDNMLDEPYRLTILMACSLLESHTIFQLQKDDKEYFVRKELLENVHPSIVLSKICREIDQKRTHNMRLDILQIVKDVYSKPFRQEVEILCPVFANYIQSKYDIQVVDDRYIDLLPNSVDIPLLIEDLLSEKGESMSVEELFSAFNNRYPDYAVDSFNKFKSYFRKAKHIRPKSKTGYYVLENWTHEYTGSIISYIEKLLQQHDKPISMDDLVKEVLQQFPYTNRNSISSMIIYDRKKRFRVSPNQKVTLINKK